MTSPIIDLDIIGELQKFDEEADDDLLKSLINIFEMAAPDRLLRMQYALQDGDRKSLCLHAHSLKSSSANFGAGHLSELCAALEHQAYESGDGPLKDLVFLIENELKKVLLELRRILDGFDENRKTA